MANNNKFIEVVRSRPASTTFIVSLVLSVIAVAANPVPNRDGMLYVQEARNFIADGLAANAAFDWSFYPLLLAGVGYISRLDPEFVAYALNALLLAGTCALMIDLTRRRMPEAAWIACLVVLAMPAYNGYRDFIIREFGYWFFCTLSFWLAMRWEELAYRWREALLCQVALCAAILFRLEAAVFFLALLLWQLFAAPHGEKLRRCFKIICLPFLAGVGALALLVVGKLPIPGRVLAYANAADLLEMKAGFRKAAEGLSGYLPVFSQNSAGLILMTGLLALIPVKFINMLGIFALPLGYGFVASPKSAVLKRWPLLNWGFCLYVLVLTAFISVNLFVSARYVSTLNLLAVPLTVAGFVLLMSRFPKFTRLFVVIALVTMVANVASFSPGKTYIKDAGLWLARNTKGPERVYIGDYRVAYYAGWIYQHGVSSAFDHKAVEQALRDGTVDIAVLHESNKDSTVSAWIEVNHYMIREKFIGQGGSKVFVITRPSILQ